MKTAKGGVGKKGVAPVKKGTAKKKVTKKPVGNAMAKKADTTPKKAPGTPVAGAAKKKPVAVKRQSARMKNTQNANSEKNDDLAVCEAMDDVLVIDSTDEVIVCETPDLTTSEAKDIDVSAKTPVKEAAQETTLGKVHTDTASSDPKEPLGSPSQEATKVNVTKIQDENVATSSGSKGTSDVLGKIENKNIFGNKKEEKVSPITGEKKVSGNLGALMANFFSRHREKEKASGSGSEETVPVTPIKENSPNNQGDEAKREADQQEKSDGAKTSENRVGKSDDNSVEKQDKGGANPPGESNSLKSADVTSFEKGKNNDAEKDCNSSERKELSPEKAIVRRPATRKGVNSPKTPTKLEEVKQEVKQEENECRKVTSSIGALLAGLGSRQEQMLESKSSPLPKGRNKTPKVEKFPVDENKSDELKVEEPEKEKAKPLKSRGSPRVEDKDQEKDNVESKKIQSLGSLLAGLGSRKEEFMSPDRQTSSVKSEIPKVDKFSAEENLSDMSKVYKLPTDESKSDELKVDEPEKPKAKLPKSRGSPRVEDKDQEKNNVESKKIQSLGSLLAGLGSRKEEFMSPDRQTSSGKSEIPKVDKLPADENKSDGFKVDEPEKQKAKPPKSRGTPRVEDKEQKKDLMESKKIQSLGSLLAGLGSRKEEFKGPDTQTSSGKIETSEVKQFPAEEDKSWNSKLDEPAMEKNESSNSTVENKKIQSLGSLLAGLGSRKEEFKAPDVQSTSGQSNTSKTNQFPSNENKWGGSKMDAPENEKSRGPQSKGPSKGEDKSSVENKKIQSLGSLLAGLGSRKEEFKAPDVQTTSGQSKPPKTNQFPANENKWGGSKMDAPENEKSRGPQSKGPSKGEDKSYVENKKIQSLGSLLAGLGSRKEEFMRSDGQPSSDSRGGRMSESDRRFGDFGFVNDKMQRNKKRSWDSSEDNNNENQNFGKSKRMEEPVVREENKVVYVRGHVPKPKPSDKELANRNKSLERNMTFEQEAERRKTHCIGNLLSSLANRPPNFPDNPPSRSHSDHQSSRGYSDRTSSRGYSDRYSDHSRDPPSRGYSDRTSRNYSDHSRDPPSRGYSDRSSSQSYPDHQSSFNNSYGQGRQWNRGRGESDFRKRRRDDDEDSDEDGRDRRWRDKDDSKKGTRDKKEREPFDPKKAAEVVKSEEERIEKEYGPGIFSVGFTENRSLAFVCEICSVQLNKTTLEVHADGMQHLKKKNLWEKKKRIQQAGSEEKVTYAGGRHGWVKVEESEKSASTTPSPAPVASAGDGSFGFDGSYGQGGYGYNNQFFKQPPPFGSGHMDMRSGDRFGAPFGVAPVNNPALAIPGPINTAIPPPPPPSAEAPPKPKNAKGGATVSLLQRLDACAVKNDKDLDLAASVISALLKSLKEFNHKRGDTKVIEVLTEIDIKFRSLKPKSVVSTYQKPANDATASTASGGKPTSSQSGYSYSESSSAPNYDNLSKDNSSGTWYSQGRGNSSGKSTAAFEAIGSNYSNKSSGSYTTASKYSSQPPPANMPSGSSTGYSQQTAKYTQGTDTTSASYYSSGYSAQTDNSTKQVDSKKYMPEKSKDTVGGYYTQPPVVSQPVYQGYPDKTGTANVMEIIRSGNEPPPPPPPESNSAHNYAAQGYHSSYPPMGYYNLSAPPPNYNPPQY